MGFGHRVYKTLTHEQNYQKKSCDEVLKDLGVVDKNLLSLWN